MKTSENEHSFLYAALVDAANPDELKGSAFTGDAPQRKFAMNILLQAANPKNPDMAKRKMASQAIRDILATDDGRIMSEEPLAKATNRWTSESEGTNDIRIWLVLRIQEEQLEEFIPDLMDVLEKLNLPAEEQINPYGLPSDLMMLRYVLIGAICYNLNRTESVNRRIVDLYHKHLLGSTELPEDIGAQITAVDS